MGGAEDVVVVRLGSFAADANIATLLLPAKQHLTRATKITASNLENHGLRNGYTVSPSYTTLSEF